MLRFLAIALFALSASASAYAAIREEAVNYKDGDTALKGYIVYDDAQKGRRPDVLVAHEWWGITGVAAFHAGLDTQQPAAPGKVKAKVLVMNGADDPFIQPDSVVAFKKEMDAAKVDYRYINYPGAVHAFTNPEATEKGKTFNLPLAYHPEADKQSRAEMEKFFSGLFGRK